MGEMCFRGRIRGCLVTMRLYRKMSRSIVISRVKGFMQTRWSNMRRGWRCVLGIRMR